MFALFLKAGKNGCKYRNSIAIGVKIFFSEMDTVSEKSVKSYFNLIKIIICCHSSIRRKKKEKQNKVGGKIYQKKKLWEFRLFMQAL